MVFKARSNFLSILKNILLRIITLHTFRAVMLLRIEILQGTAMLESTFSIIILNLDFFQ